MYKLLIFFGMLLAFGFLDPQLAHQVDCDEEPIGHDDAAEQEKWQWKDQRDEHARTVEILMIREQFVVLGQNLV